MPSFETRLRQHQCRHDGFINHEAGGTFCSLCRARLVRNPAMAHCEGDHWVPAESLDMIPADRAGRQRAMFEWCSTAFPDASHPLERSMRFLEEAIELYQSVGHSSRSVSAREFAHMLVDHVFDRPPGDVVHEAGSVMVTALALCSSLGIDADEAERAELTRIFSKPLSHFQARQQDKVERGLAAA